VPTPLLKLLLNAEFRQEDSSAREAAVKSRLLTMLLKLDVQETDALK
jgi:hypothetical protein